MPPLITALHSLIVKEVDTAIAALLMIYHDKEGMVIVDALEGIISNRRTLQTFCQKLERELYLRRKSILPTAYLILDKLAVDPVLNGLRVSLAIEALPRAELAQFLERLTAEGQFHPGILMIACPIIESMHPRADDEEIEKLETILAASSDDKLRRLAFSALIAQTRSVVGWTDPLIQRLHHYRADPSPLVAGIAQFTELQY